MSVTTRFAPSPTGHLHVGNARTALVCWLWARHRGGRFVLRLDDTDRERSTAAFAEAIEADLTWLGLNWDLSARQSDRAELYAAGIARLKQAGRLYPCYETAHELALKRKAQLAAGRPPRYDRAALAQTAADIEAHEAAGRRPHWRFRLDHAPIVWRDRIRGEVRFDGAELSDPVVIREDGRPLYHLCSVIDDIDLGITDIVRGEDHVDNTAAHIQMFEALGATPPNFAHLALIVDADGKALSKRLGSLTLLALREERGLEPEALVNLLARLGTALPPEPLADTAPLVGAFDFGKFSRAAARFDEAELARLNARILHGMTFDGAAHRLERIGLGRVDAAFWHGVRPNLETLADVATWWRIAREPVAPFADEAEFLTLAADLLPEEPWGEQTWPDWIAAIKAATGRKGKSLFAPLRQALTGLDHGPELRALLPLIGRARVVQRLSGGRSGPAMDPRPAIC